MKKKIAAAVAILVCGIALAACGSNNSKSQSAECAICHKELKGSEIVNATTAKGQDVVVCKDCYRIGKAAGKCL